MSLRLFDDNLTYSANGLLKEMAFRQTISSRAILQAQDTLLIAGVSTEEGTSLGSLKTLHQRWSLPPGLHLWD
jgi:hypothetical protein